MPLLNDRPASPPADLKQACVEAARAIIAERGVEQLSLREVSRRLGVSHQAPYKHYASRDHLLAEVMRRCFESFAQALDARPRHDDPAADLDALGRRYLEYAAAHPLEYRLMFATPWPEPAAHPALVRDAGHAFDVLRGVLRRLHGGRAPRERIDTQAMYIFALVHGLASIAQSNLMDGLDLAPALRAGLHEHVMALSKPALQPPPGRARTPAR
jgi:AcrR family transcriptional regulator